MSLLPAASAKCEVSFTVNGHAKKVLAHPMERLLDVLRNDTIEGMAAHALMKLLQESFLECGGAQCGICTPGMILAAVHLLEKKPQPALTDIREGLAGNLCRCTGYMQIFEAVAKAARQRVAQ
ncbi:MAG: hypothetical protein AUI12_00785 [Acidobacteria bacterium 13_2_20CM_2_57_6]|nr:MAG: hypothetical protein AUI12_00785 [Acidobacteria bacterium 13_2_20CM_2_57_6]